MKRTRIKPISEKREAILKAENILRDKMLEECQGRCMICRKLPDWRGLEKNHTKYREVFILSCRECHSPGGVHRYLEI